jgi:TolA-binding protein
MDDLSHKDSPSQSNSEVKREIPGADSGVNQAAPPPAAPPSKPTQPLRVRLLRWTLGVLLLFALGFTTAVVWLYLPMRQHATQLQRQLQQSAQQLEAQTGQSNERIASLESEVDRLSQVESQNADLQSQLAEQQLHSAILAARMDVSAAQLALSRDDPARLRLAFVKTPETWDQISDHLKPDQRKIVEDMRNLMELALESAEGEPAAAESALDQLAASLVELENAYFARP